MKFCNQCGQMLEDDAVFCSNCGNDVSNKTSQQTNILNNQYVQQPQTNTNQYQNYQQGYAYQNDSYQPSPAVAIKPKKNKAKKIIFSFVAVFLALVIIIVSVSIHHSKSNSLTTSSSSNSSYLSTDTNGSSDGDYAITDKNMVSTRSDELGTYTVLIYMIGSNLESGGGDSSQGGAATADINEMLKSNVDTSKVNIVIYAGGASSWNLPISKENKNIITMTSKNGENTLSYDNLGSNENMAEPDTLKNFLDYGYNNYKADHYSLILWDHGGESIYGVDELYNNQYMVINQIDEALDASPFTENNKLDWVGYDACLMAGLESANYWSNNAKYYIASEETESGAGWYYKFMNKLNTTNDPVEIAKSIIDTTASYYDSAKSALYNPDYTISCMDLSKVENVYSNAKKVVDSICTDLEVGNTQALSYSQPGAKEFGLSSSNDHSYLYDMVSYANTIKSYYPTETENLINAVTDAVVYNKANISDCYGMSFIYPFYNYDAGNSSSSSSSSASSSYGKSLNDLQSAYGNSIANNNASWNLPDVTITDDEASITLSDSQISDLYEAYYTVLVDTSEGSDSGYTPVMKKCKLVQNENGTFSISLTPNVVVAESVVDENTTSQNYISVEQTALTSDGANYKTVKCAYYADFNFGTRAVDKFVSMNFAADNDNNLTVTDTYALDDSMEIIDKCSVDPSEWNYIGNVFRRYIPTNEASEDWNTDDWYLITYSRIGDDVEYNLVPTSETSDDFVAQIVFVDKSGETHATSLIDLKNKYDCGTKTTEVATSQGTLKFEIGDKSAKLISYTGTDTTVTIPKKVDGVKVKEIGSAAFGTNLEPNSTIETIELPNTIETLEESAFSNCYSLKSVNIPKKVTVIPANCFYNTAITTFDVPKTVKEIGEFAFANTDLETINLPKKLKKLGQGVFGGVQTLTSITFGEKSEGKNFVMQDNMLLSADGKTLYTGIVSKDATSITIPDGVEVIENYAFCEMIEEPFTLLEGTNITSISFPDTLQVIGDSAFKGIVTLEEINLPDSLTTIGYSAFTDYMYQNGTIDTVKIGPNVEKIKDDAFGSYIINNFVVDENNKRYASENGKLMNKGKDVEIKVDYDGI